MAFESSSCQVQELACLKGHKTTVDKLFIANGRCPFCRGTRFAATVVRSAVVVERDKSLSAGNLAAKAGLGTTGLSGGIQRTEYVLADVDGKELAQELRKSADEGT